MDEIISQLNAISEELSQIERTHRHIEDLRQRYKALGMQEPPILGELEAQLGSEKVAIAARSLPRELPAVEAAAVDAPALK